MLAKVGGRRAEWRTPAFGWRRAMQNPERAGRLLHIRGKLPMPPGIADLLWDEGVDDRALVFDLTINYQIQHGVWHVLGPLADRHGFGSTEVAAALRARGFQFACQRCGKSVLRWSPHNRFCGVACRERWLAEHPRDGMQCLQCGAAFSPSRRTQLCFCSRRCRQLADMEEQRQRTLDAARLRQLGAGDGRASPMLPPVAGTVVPKLTPFPPRNPISNPVALA